MTPSDEFVTYFTMLRHWRQKCLQKMRKIHSFYNLVKIWRPILWSYKIRFFTLENSFIAGSNIGINVIFYCSEFFHVSSKHYFLQNFSYVSYKKKVFHRCESFHASSKLFHQSTILSNIGLNKVFHQCEWFNSFSYFWPERNFFGILHKK